MTFRGGIPHSSILLRISPHQSNLHWNDYSLTGLALSFSSCFFVLWFHSCLCQSDPDSRSERHPSSPKPLRDRLRNERALSLQSHPKTRGSSLTWPSALLQLPSSSLAENCSRPHQKKRWLDMRTEPGELLPLNVILHLVRTKWTAPSKRLYRTPVEVGSVDK